VFVFFYLEQIVEIEYIDTPTRKIEKIYIFLTFCSSHFCLCLPPTTTAPSTLYSLNPVWTPKLDNTFAIKELTCKIIDNDGLVFKVMDYDMLSSDEMLGTVTFSPKEMQEACGKLVTKKIVPPPDKKNMKGKCGMLTFRARQATDADFASLKKKECKQLFSDKDLSSKEGKKDTMQAIAQAKKRTSKG